MKIRHIIAGLCTVAATSTASAVASQTGPNPYRAVQWGTLPQGRTWGPTSAIQVDRDGRHVWVFDRCGSPHTANDCIGRDEVDPIMKFDADGNLVKSFGRGMFVFPHGIHLDRAGNVWVADAASAEDAPAGKGQQIFKFSPDGELLMTLGTAGVAGNGPNQFNRPTDVVVASNGDIFVSDGHDDNGTGNDRIVKFSSDGRYIKEWGGSGSARGQFFGPHTIAIDSQDRIFVGDRGNNRIQIFDQEGELLSVWTQFGKPSGIFIDSNDKIYVADSESATEHRHPNPGWERGIRVGDARTGWVEDFILWEDSTEDPTRAGPGPDGSGAEDVTADAAGNLYLGIVRTPRVQKYVRIRP